MYIKRAKSAKLLKTSPQLSGLTIASNCVRRLETRFLLRDVTSFATRVAFRRFNKNLWRVLVRVAG